MAVGELIAGAQRVGAKNYKMRLTIHDFGTLTGKTLRVRILRPEGTSFDRTTAAAEVAVISSSDKESLLDVAVVDGDWTAEGEYKAQVFDETGGGSRRSEFAYFWVGASLPAPVP